VYKPAQPVEVKGTNSPIGPLSRHSSASSSIICHAPRLCYLVMCRIFGLLRSCRWTALDKDIELMVLRQEVRVLKRQLHVRVRHRTADRAILAAFSRLLPRWRWRCFPVTPETLLRRHRELSRQLGAARLSFRCHTP
jgi:hypothetical protein